MCLYLRYRFCIDSKILREDNSSRGRGKATSGISTSEHSICLLDGKAPGGGIKPGANPPKRSKNTKMDEGAGPNNGRASQNSRVTSGSSPSRLGALTIGERKHKHSWGVKTNKEQFIFGPSRPSSSMNSSKNSHNSHNSYKDQSGLSKVSPKKGILKHSSYPVSTASAVEGHHSPTGMNRSEMKKTWYPTDRSTNQNQNQTIRDNEADKSNNDNDFLPRKKSKKKKKNTPLKSLIKSVINFGLPVVFFGLMFAGFAPVVRAWHMIPGSNESNIFYTFQEFYTDAQYGK